MFVVSCECWSSRPPADALCGIEIDANQLHIVRDANLFTDLAGFWIDRVEIASGAEAIRDSWDTGRVHVHRICHWATEFQCRWLAEGGLVRGPDCFENRLVATRDLYAEEAHRRHLPPTPKGPSPGFRELKWLQPVYVGDIVSYSTTPIEKRNTSRQGWGIAFHRNEGVNQNGEKVFEYISSSFWPVRD